MITEYNKQCAYNYNKLKDVVYLLNENHTKLIYDGVECKIEGLSGTTLQLNVRNVELSEQSSLDERYRFDKTLTFSFDGFYAQENFQGRYYAVIEDYEGTRWVVNVDFPSYVTYSFNLENNVYETNYTFRNQSNFPTMRLVSDFDYEEPACKIYSLNGVYGLEMVERIYTELDTDKKKVYTYGKDFQVVEPDKNSISLNQTFDGTKVTDTISFTIPFDKYKYGWHYNLQHMLNNEYSAIITPNSRLNKFFVGFNTGLIPTYTVDNDNTSQRITVTLTEVSNIGMTAAEDYSVEAQGNKNWVYVSEVDGEPSYECNGNGTAIYLVQEETYDNGVKTGRYKVKEGYESQFPNLNIVGTFSADVTFHTTDCVEIVCDLEDSIPSVITFQAATSYTYNVVGTCSWSFSGIPEDITVTPTEGTGSTNIQIGCSQIPDDGATYYMELNVGDLYVRPITINIEGINDKRVKNTGVDCLAQDVVFNLDYGYDCQIITPVQGALYTRKENGTITVGLSKNETSSAKRYTLNLQDVNGTYSVTINQTRMFSDVIENGTICENGNLYQAMELYTGATPTNLYPTGSVSAGTLVEENALQCSDVMTRWTSGTGTVCLSGNEWSTIIEQQSTDNGATWSATGVIQLDKIIIENSPICAQPVTEYWVLTNDYICDEAIPT